MILGVAACRCRDAGFGLFHGMRSPCEASRQAVPQNSPVSNGTFCPQPQRRFVLIAAILASALGFIDGSVVSIAIPAIRSDIGATLADAQWISNAYALTLSALILAGGAAGDNFGLRRTFVAGIVLFVAASLACALAPGPGSLIAARAVQGIGAAIMVPGSLAIIAKAYPKKERGRAIGIWAASSALTTALGPVIGGLVLSAFDDSVWRLIFAINLPLGGAAIYLLLFKVPAGQADRKTQARSQRRGDRDRRARRARLRPDRAVVGRRRIRSGCRLPSSPPASSSLSASSSGSAASATRWSTSRSSAPAHSPAPTR